METLYLTEPDVTLRRVGRTLRVEHPDGWAERAWVSDLRHVFVFGDTPLDLDLLLSLAAEGVNIIWLTENGHFRARMRGRTRPGSSLLRAQYACAADEGLCLENARAIVRRKIQAQAGLLRRHKRNIKTASQLTRDPAAAEELKHLRIALWQAIHDIDMLCRDVRRAASLSDLRALEGRAAAIYFSCWGMLLRGRQDFYRRARRPPPDPVNALLSLTYSLLGAEVESQLEAVGLDPRVGFLHVEHGRRPALALDLLEEFRAEIADRLVLRLIKLGMLRPKDFIFAEDGSCRLTRQGRAVFFPQYERFLTKPFTDLLGRRINYRRLLHVQAREMAQACLDHRPYCPHPPRL